MQTDVDDEGGSDREFKLAEADVHELATTLSMLTSDLDLIRLPTDLLAVIVAMLNPDPDTRISMARVARHPAFFMPWQL